MYLFYATFVRNAHTCSNILYVHHLRMDPMHAAESTVLHESTVSLLRLTSTLSQWNRNLLISTVCDGAHVVVQSSEKEYHIHMSDSHTIRKNKGRKFINGCKTAISQYEGCSLSAYSLYLLGIIQQAAPKQQQQMMTGTDIRITNRMSNAITIPTTLPGVRPANRKHVCVKNAFYTKEVEYDASLGGYGLCCT